MTEDNDPPYHFIGICLIAAFIGLAMAVHGAGMSSVQQTRAKPIAVAEDSSSTWRPPIQ
ncbi:hypothetical protein [Neorhizobium alkalisoli]|jgi:hypothetical protein|uniref:Uncharacterized protein n=1 Tax=Neorhizobium alkalisoli TaxID=528178 RepID=A0A561QJ34_9HYPH|nr:hypothetical protein [Neorhizobium alkalisoli]TWF50370.1 hypothetical protein FHW37_106333 [Neorhizobium alkalisoli]